MAWISYNDPASRRPLFARCWNRPQGVAARHCAGRHDTDPAIRSRNRGNRFSSFFEHISISTAVIQANCKAALVGAVVMTRYNNKTYRIDDIDFLKNPQSTFHLRKEDRDISYMEYYSKRYQVTIRSVSQPLLVSRPTRRDKNRGDDQPIFLIPELCGMTGLSDEQRWVRL